MHGHDCSPCFWGLLFVHPCPHFARSYRRFWGLAVIFATFFTPSQFETDFPFSKFIEKLVHIATHLCSCVTGSLLELNIQTPEFSEVQCYEWIQHQCFHKSIKHWWLKSPAIPFSISLPHWLHSKAPVHVSVSVLPWSISSRANTIPF